MLVGTGEPRVNAFNGRFDPRLCYDRRMRNVLLLLTLLLFSAANFPAQDQNWAPVTWERYVLLDKSASVMFPKLPNVSEAHDECEAQLRWRYDAFAEGVVYQLSVIIGTKPPKIRPFWCAGRKTLPVDQAEVDRRLQLIKKDQAVLKDEVPTRPGITAHRVTQSNATRLIIADLDNNRIIEMSMVYYDDSKPDLQRFFGSLEFTASGKEIGTGAKFTLGDPPAPRSTEFDSASKSSAAGAPEVGANLPELKPKTLPPGTFPFRLLSKPRALYTDAARRKSVNGSVMLKVTLQANGSVGNVTVTKELPYGLTESAIAAARRVVFLPKRVNFEPVTVLVTMEYTFTIY